MRFFSLCCEIAGKEREEFALAEADTVARLIERVMKRYPAMKEMGGSIMVAVNYRQAHKREPLHRGDEVALMPPFAGG